MQLKFIEFPGANSQGDLRVSIEGLRHIPFPIASVHYICNLTGGEPSSVHRRAATQLVLCLRGSCKIMLSDGTKKREAFLDRPNQGLLIEPMIGHAFRGFSVDCIISIVASGNWDDALDQRQSDTEEALG